MDIRYKAGHLKTLICGIDFICVSLEHVETKTSKSYLVSCFESAKKYS